MKIEKFEIERFLCMYEREVEFNLSESGVLPLRLSELLDGVDDVERFIASRYLRRVHPFLKHFLGGQE